MSLFSNKSGMGFGRFESIEDLENVINLGHLNEGGDPFGRSDEEEAAVVILRTDVVVHDDPEARSVHEGDLGEVHDETLRLKGS